jgi:hypothetical protein
MLAVHCSYTRWSLLISPNKELILSLCCNHFLVVNSELNEEHSVLVSRK